MPRKRTGAILLAVGVLLVLTLDLAGATASSGFGARPRDNVAATPEGWRLTPAGKQTALGNGPLDLAVSPDGALALVANAGYQKQSLMVIDTATGKVKQTIPASNSPVHGYYVGLAFTRDGKSAYAADGPGDGLHVFKVWGGVLAEQPEIGLGPAVWPAGIAIAADGARLYVAANLADRLLFVDPTAGQPVRSVPVGHLPYAVTLNHTGTLAYVSDWGGGTVSVVNVVLSAVVATIATGLHPSALAMNPHNGELYVANTDSDTATVIDTTSNRVLRTIDLRPFAGARIGTSPEALAVSPDGATLYVANAGDNDIAVVKLGPAGSTSGEDRVLGLIPTGWYPTGLSATSSEVLVVNMYGLGVGPVKPKQYIGALMRGTLSRIRVPREAQLRAYTRQVKENDKFWSIGSQLKGNAVPSTVGAPSPIKHVIYVLKENRTYDQILGDLAKGNGDPRLEMFPFSVTPNQHALANRFVTLDNLYTDGAVSADGWSWSTEAYSNSYTNKNWPPDYGIYNRPYDFGGFGNNETAGLVGPPASSFLWDRLAQAGISYRNYGFFMNQAPVQVPISMPNLVGHTDLNYTGWNLNYSDQRRVNEWMREFAGYRASGSLPTMEFVYLPQDHTMGTASRRPKPTAMIADNDLALGRLVEAVSHSQFWPSTAIFVVEDDAQDGPDHVSGHRTIAQVISPYTQRGYVDSTPYSTVSMLRTMELILGLQPITQFDAAATPMYESFSSRSDLAAYDALVPEQPLTALNLATDPMAAYFAAADWSHPDAVPEGLLNSILLASVSEGANPRRSSSKADRALN